jgi:hypothetical protein
MVNPHAIFKTAAFLIFCLLASLSGEGRTASPKDQHFFVWPVCYAADANGR